MTRKHWSIWTRHSIVGKGLGFSCHQPGARTKLVFMVEGWTSNGHRGLRAVAAILAAGALLAVSACKVDPKTGIPMRFKKCGPVTYTTSSLYGMCGLVKNPPSNVSFKVVTGCGPLEPDETELAFLCEGVKERIATAPVYPASQIADLYADKTRLSYGPRHGNQVEYTSADGKAHLWYPGQDQVVVGKWNVPEGKYVCFHYPDIAVDRISGGLADRFACHVIEDAIKDSHAVDGDVFDLTESYWVPYGLNRHPRASVNEVKSKIKKYKPY